MRYFLTLHYLCERCRSTVSFKKSYNSEHSMMLGMSLPPMLAIIDLDTKQVENEPVEFVHECRNYRDDAVKKFGLCRFIGYDDEREK